MRFVVIEGLDGSGKSTQLELLKEYLDKEGVKYKYLHFPRLEEGLYGKMVARFLRGELGSIDQVHPYLVALLFAGDRQEAAPIIRGWMDEGSLVIVDRYVYSNIAFQCAKLSDPAERAELRDWILDLEFVKHELPRPDLNLLLHVPESFTRKKLGSKRSGDDRAYLRGERDIHEESIDFQARVKEEYLDLQKHVTDLELIDCSLDNGEMKDPGTISGQIIQRLVL